MTTTAAPAMALEGVIADARRLGWLVHTWCPSASFGSDGGFPTLILADNARRHRAVAVLFLPDGAEPSLGEAAWLHVLASVARIETVVWTPTTWLSGEAEAYLR